MGYGDSSDGGADSAFASAVTKSWVCSIIINRQLDKGLRKRYFDCNGEIYILITECSPAGYVNLWESLFVRR